MNPDFWKDKKVLVTGHTGFKGSWLCLWLNMLGARVIGFSLDIPCAEGNFQQSGVEGILFADIRGDIRDNQHLESVFREYQPEIVFHLAAQPIVLTSYDKPRYTYEVNVMGTLNVLECIRMSDSVRTAIMVTTDKVYENKETLRGYVETDPYGGYDPYSSSKACDEILISSYRNSFFSIDRYDTHGKSISSVRAGNVIGGGDWADNRLVPDCMRALEKKQQILIRNRFAVRPWQHVLEPLSGYILLAEKMYHNPVKYSGGWNFGPNENGVWNVGKIAECIVKHYGYGEIVDYTSPSALHEAGKLCLNISKAETILGWKPVLDVDEAIAWTVEWYKQYKMISARKICEKEITEYMERIS